VEVQLRAFVRVCVQDRGEWLVSPLSSFTAQGENFQCHVGKRRDGPKVGSGRSGHR